MNNHKLKALVISIITLLIALELLDSCQRVDDLEPTPPKSQSQPVAQKADIKATVGHNPYALKSMRQAWANLRSRRNGANNARILEKDVLAIQGSHLYLRFKPKDEDELDLLEQDTTLEIFGYPIDTEVLSDSIEQLLNEGKVYRDAGVPADQPPYQYCAVPIDAKLPQVSYEILDSLFIPDEDTDEFKSTARPVTAPDKNSPSISDLVRESMIITNNLDTNLEKVARRCGRYTPHGRIRVWDGSIDTVWSTRQVFVRNERYHDCYTVSDGAESSGAAGGSPKRRICTEHVRPIYRTETFRSGVNGAYVPIAGLRVRARRWVKVKFGTTDAQGFYRCNGSFRRPARFSFKWQRYDFSIRAGYLGQARVNAGQHCNGWSYDIGRPRGDANVHDKQQYYALIYQAANDYYYGNRFNLQSPPRNGALKKQIKIAAILKNGANSGHAAYYLHDPAITIPSAVLFMGLGGLSGSVVGILAAAGLSFATLSAPTVYIKEYGDAAQLVYGATIHELAHFAHWDMDRAAYRNLAREGYVNGLVGDRAVMESWATGVEVLMTNERYRRIGNPNHNYEGGFQNRPTRGNETNRAYTSIVIDMMDGDNQRVLNSNNDLPQDRVSGYTILQIQQGLRGVKAWHEWRDNMRGISNLTSNNINELFGNWH